MRIREVSERDITQLAALYANSVRALGPGAYSSAQVDAWASFSEDLQDFRRFILEPRTVVIEDDDRIVGFCGIDRMGHVASLYVHGNYARQGIGSMLLGAALHRAAAGGIVAFHAEASRLSLTVFRQFGFTVRGADKSMRNGVEFERYLVTTASPV